MSDDRSQPRRGVSLAQAKGPLCPSGEEVSLVILGLHPSVHFHNHPINRVRPALSQISPQTRWSRPQSRWIPFHYRETLTTAKVRRAEEPSALDYAAQQLKEDQIGQVRELLKRGDTGQRPELSLPVLDSRQRQAVCCEVTTTYPIMCCAQNALRVMTGRVASVCRVDSAFAPEQADAVFPAWVQECI